MGKVQYYRDDLKKVGEGQRKREVKMMRRVAVEECGVTVVN